MHRLLWVVIVVASTAAIAEVELTPALGFRIGAEIEFNRVSAFRVETSPALGLTLDFDLNPTQWVSVLWSGQRTRIEGAGLLPDSDRFDFDIHYLHAGGVYRPLRDKKTQPFVMMSGGLTWVVPKRSGFGSEPGFSLAAGGGWIVPLNDRLAFRFDARAYLTFTTITMSGSCGGTDCSVRLSGSGALQIEGLFGLSIGF